MGFCFMILKLIMAWLALQIPLGALIGTCIQHGMVQPRRREETCPDAAAPALLEAASALGA